MAQFLRFKLHVDEHGWPPAGVESVPVMAVGSGFQILVPPFFISDLSVGDVLACNFDDEGYADKFDYVYRSARSTVWVSTQSSAEWPMVKEELLKQGCNIETLEQFDIASIDLPESISLEVFDRVMQPVIATGCFVAYPSLRHGESQSIK